MDNARCKAFLECVECGSITGAAYTLGYTPSAVSQLISALEKDLGLKLLTRSQKGVKLTSEGSAVLPAIRAYLQQEQEIYQIASNLKGVLTGKLTLAVYPSVATTWLPEIVRKFKADYPGIQISIMESIRSDIFNHIEQNVADLGIMAYSDPMPYEWIRLTEGEVVAAVPEDHELAGLSAFPVERSEEFDFALGSWGNELEILSIFEKYNVRPEIKYTTYDTPATLALVRMGLCVSFVNELSARHWNENIVKMPLDPPQSLSFGIVLPPKERLTSAARKFIKYAKAHFGIE